MENEEKFPRLERRIKTVEDAVQLLTELIINYDEEINDFDKNSEELNAKIAAPVDAQIRGEDKIQRVTDLVEAARLRIDRLES
jgi:chromosome segregation ATPase